MPNPFTALLNRANRRRDDSGLKWRQLDLSSDHVFEQPPRELYVGGTAGDLGLVGGDGHMEVFPVLANSYHPFSPTIVKSSATTTAGPIFAIW